MLTALEFFVGSGLVRTGLASHFTTLWANDICPKKRDTYVANHGGEAFHLADIKTVRGMELPAADLAWASFPCQDLSLAGNMVGMTAGTRSGLFWEWLRILQELKVLDRLPPVLVAENVAGFLVADHSRHFSDACKSLRDLGYRVGALVIDANEFVPQSRVRAFIVAVLEDVACEGLIQRFPSGPFHTKSLVRAAFVANDPDWVWWRLPATDAVRPDFIHLCERNAPFDHPRKTEVLCEMLSVLNQKKLQVVKETGAFFAGTAYKRTRPDESGKRVQRLEVRFDGTAGCLRTPNGGSSRQSVIVVDNGKVRSRLMTPRECARLMGAPDTFRLVGSYNDAYRAMGDAVAVPVTRWLSRHLLSPLVQRSKLCERTDECASAIMLPSRKVAELAHA